MISLIDAGGGKHQGSIIKIAWLKCFDMQINLVCQSDVKGRVGTHQSNPSAGSEQAKCFAATDIAGADHDTEAVSQVKDDRIAVHDGIRCRKVRPQPGHRAGCR